MPTDPATEITRAVAAHKRTKAANDKALAAVHDAIRAAHAAGLKQAEIVKLTGYTREHIRQITR